MLCNKLMSLHVGMVVAQRNLLIFGDRSNAKNVDTHSADMLNQRIAFKAKDAELTPSGGELRRRQFPYYDG